jgi:FkbM family methyltransferase
LGIFNAIYNTWIKSQNNDIFSRVCQSNNLKLNNYSDIDDFAILKEIFVNRVYSDYFPFYQKVNIIDIGAHKGFFTIFCAKNTNPDSKIICLEPLENNYTELLENLKLNNISNVFAIKSGIYSETTKIDLHISKSQNNSIFSHYNSLLHNIQSEKTIKINVISLKDLMEKHEILSVDFLKIDCEGAEYPALFATDISTLEKIKTISMEFHDLKDEKYTGLKMVEFLENNGFRIVKFIHEATTIDNNFGKIIAVRR